MALAKINGLFRLTREAELRYSNSGNEIVKFGLVCSEKYQDKETTLFIDAVAFGKFGKIIYDYAGKKGNQIYLNGKLQTESWQDNQGQNRSKVSMIIKGFDFVSNNKQQSQSNNYTQQNKNNSYEEPPVEYQNNIPEIDIDEKDIPF